MSLYTYCRDLVYRAINPGAVDRVERLFDLIIDGIHHDRFNRYMDIHMEFGTLKLDLEARTITMGNGKSVYSYKTHQLDDVVDLIHDLIHLMDKCNVFYSSRKLDDWYDARTYPAQLPPEHTWTYDIARRLSKKVLTDQTEAWYDFIANAKSFTDAEKAYRTALDTLPIRTSLPDVYAVAAITDNSSSTYGMGVEEYKRSLTEQVLRLGRLFDESLPLTSKEDTLGAVVVTAEGSMVLGLSSLFVDRYPAITHVKRQGDKDTVTSTQLASNVRIYSDECAKCYIEIMEDFAVAIEQMWERSGVSERTKRLIGDAELLKQQLMRLGRYTEEDINASTRSARSQ